MCNIPSLSLPIRLDSLEPRGGTWYFFFLPSYYSLGSQLLWLDVFVVSAKAGQTIRYDRAWTVNGGNATDSPVTAYYLRSTVLGGRIISEYNGQGLLNTSYAYAGDERVGQF